MPPIHFGSATFDAGLVIFDKDGTLTHFDPLWQSIYRSAVRAVTAQVENPALVTAELHATLGYDPIDSRFSTHGPFTTAANATVSTVVATVLYRHAQPPLAWDAAQALAAHTFLAAMDAPINPALLTAPTDLPALFDSLASKGVAIAVITSDERAQTLFTLDVLGVGQRVGLVIASDDAYPQKPAPEAIWAACAHFGVATERAVMVGDSLTDMRMGRAAGVGLCVGVLTGPASLDQLLPHADVVLTSIAEIRAAMPLIHKQ